MSTARLFDGFNYYFSWNSYGTAKNILEQIARLAGFMDDPDLCEGGAACGSKAIVALSNAIKIVINYEGPEGYQGMSYSDKYAIKEQIAELCFEGSKTYPNKKLGGVGVQQEICPTFKIHTEKIAYPEDFFQNEDILCLVVLDAVQKRDAEKLLTKRGLDILNNKRKCIVPGIDENKLAQQAEELAASKFTKAKPAIQSLLWQAAKEAARMMSQQEMKIDLTNAPDKVKDAILEAKAFVR